MIEHQMALEAEEPANASLAALGQTGKPLVAVDPTRMTHRQGCAVDIVDAPPSSRPRQQKDRQGHPDMVGQCDEAGITGSLGKRRAQQGENDALVERLKLRNREL
jgi:hypothetical protein